MLLTAEAQLADRLKNKRRRRAGDAGRSAALRAKNLAAEGAYRKAVQGLTSETAQLTKEEQEAWARKLLPSTGRAASNQVLDSGGEASDGGSVAPPGGGAAGKVLEGVRFAALSGPGPSGMRPEHLKDALSARSRGVASRLRSTVAEFFSVAVAGQLNHCVRWVLDSRLVFLKKKTGPAPRPVRIGEVWRRLVGKKLVHETRTEAQGFFLGGS